ncbi:MAG TPA: putative Ig domain-containing protein [Devosia sp.]|nr:putative Ig domain-containing protein [Devosia sp.]
MQPPTITLSPSVLPAGTYGATYSNSLSATGGTGPYSFAMTSGASPPGLAFSSAGVFSGTLSDASTFNFTITATDQYGYTGTRNYSIVVIPGSQTITFNNPGPQSFGTSPNLTATASSGLLVSFASLTPQVCTIDSASGDLATLAAGNCSIEASQSGDNGNYNVASVSQTFAIIVPGGAVSISSSSLPDGVAGTPYSATIVASGGASPYTFGVTGGSLPPGLQLLADGSLSGTATAAGPFDLTVEATDAAAQTASKTYTLTINAPTIAITPSLLPSGTVGGTYPAMTFAASGGTSPYTFTVTSGALPDGLALSSAGLLSGIPTKTAAFSFTMTATDSLAFSQSQTYAVSIGLGSSQTSLSASPNPSVDGQTVTLTATVANAASGSGTPSGTVDFFDGPTLLGTGSLSGGVATFAIASLSRGPHQLTAHYEGDADFGGSASSFLQQQVNEPPDSLRLRAMQVLATQLEAQTSGRAFSQSIEHAVYDGFSVGNKLVIQPGAIQFNYASDAPVSGADVPWPDQVAGQPVAGTTQIWGRLQGTGVGQWSANNVGPNDVSGLQINAFGGLGYHPNPDTLIGVLGGYEAFDYTSTSLNGHLTGQGGTVGVYGGSRFGDARLFGGVGYSEINYNVTAGAASGQLDGHRWLFSGGIDGDIEHGGFIFTPSLTLFALGEAQDGYTDSLGTVQSPHSTYTGTASAGIKVAYPVNYNGAKILPYAGLYADFSSQNAGDDELAAVGVDGNQLASLLNGGVTARAAAGASVDLDDGTSLGLSSELGGIGGGTQTWGLSLRLGKGF